MRYTGNVHSGYEVTIESNKTEWRRFPATSREATQTVPEHVEVLSEMWAVTFPGEKAFAKVQRHEPRVPQLDAMPHN